MNSREEILHFLHHNKSEILKRFHLVHIGLFGSFSRDKATQESDVDILVDFDDKVKDVYATKQSLRAYLSEHFGRPVDLARDKYLKPYARDAILKEAIYV
jgi:predicted nucleotidyltransferase